MREVGRLIGGPERIKNVVEDIVNQETFVNLTWNDLTVLMNSAVLSRLELLLTAEETEGDILDEIGGPES